MSWSIHPFFRHFTYWYGTKTPWSTRRSHKPCQCSDFWRGSTYKLLLLLFGKEQVYAPTICQNIKAITYRIQKWELQNAAPKSVKCLTFLPERFIIFLETKGLSHCPMVTPET